MYGIIHVLDNLDVSSAQNDSLLFDQVFLFAQLSLVISLLPYYIQVLIVTTALQWSWR